MGNLRERALRAATEAHSESLEQMRRDLFAASQTEAEFDSLVAELSELAAERDENLSHGAFALLRLLNVTAPEIRSSYISDPMTWQGEQLAAIVEGKRAIWRSLDSSLPKDIRQELWSRHSDLDNRVSEAVTQGVLPLHVITAFLHDSEATAEYVAFVAAGPIEDLLRDFPERYAAQVEQLCRSDQKWAGAIGGVWLSDEEWDACGQYLKELHKRVAY